VRTATPWIVGLAVVVSLVPYAVMFGTEGAIFGKTFRPEWRYSGSSLAFNLAGIIGGGPAPFVATWLLARYGNPYPIALYIAVAGMVGLAAVITLQRRNAAMTTLVDRTPGLQAGAVVDDDEWPKVSFTAAR
jgi:hypothetical protein